MIDSFILNYKTVINFIDSNRGVDIPEEIQSCINKIKLLIRDFFCLDRFGDDITKFHHEKLLEFYYEIKKSELFERLINLDGSEKIGENFSLLSLNIRNMYNKEKDELAKEPDSFDLLLLFFDFKEKFFNKSNSSERRLEISKEFCEILLKSPFFDDFIKNINHYFHDQIKYLHLIDRKSGSSLFFACKDDLMLKILGSFEINHLTYLSSKCLRVYNDTGPLKDHIFNEFINALKISPLINQFFLSIFKEDSSSSICKVFFYQIIKHTGEENLKYFSMNTVISKDIQEFIIINEITDLSKLLLEGNLEIFKEKISLLYLKLKDETSDDFFKVFSLYVTQDLLLHILNHIKDNPEEFEYILCQNNKFFIEKSLIFDLPDLLMQLKNLNSVDEIHSYIYASGFEKKDFKKGAEGFLYCSEKRTPADTAIDAECYKLAEALLKNGTGTSYSKDYLYNKAIDRSDVNLLDMILCLEVSLELAQNYLNKAIALNNLDLVGVFLDHGIFPSIDEVKELIDSGKYDVIDFIIKNSDYDEICKSMKLADESNIFKLFIQINEIFFEDMPSSKKFVSFNDEVNVLFYEKNEELFESIELNQ